jgi:hypothetical protein
VIAGATEDAGFRSASDAPKTSFFFSFEAMFDFVSWPLISMLLATSMVRD